MPAPPSWCASIRTPRRTGSTSLSGARISRSTIRSRGGYYVRYPDGYESWSPAHSFEEGYTLIVDDEGGETDKAPPVPVQRPAVGRIVQVNVRGTWIAAVICFVHNDTMVNLRAWDENGNPLSRTSVGMGEDLDQWRWPPRV